MKIILLMAVWLISVNYLMYTQPFLGTLLLVGGLWFALQDALR